MSEHIHVTKNSNQDTEPHQHPRSSFWPPPLPKDRNVFAKFLSSSSSKAGSKGLKLKTETFVRGKQQWLLFSCSVVFDSATPWTAARQASQSFTISQSLLKLMFIEWVMPSNHLVLCCPLLLLPSVFPSIRVFSNDSALPIRWPKYWNFSFNISPSKEHSGLISFRMDCLDLLAVQGILKILFSSTTVQRHQFFGSQPFLFSSSNIHTWLLKKT